MSEVIHTLPAQALYQLLLDTGHAHTKHQFARLAGISVGNVYNYVPNYRGTRKTPPFRATLETVRRWTSNIVHGTGLRIDVALQPDVVVFSVSGRMASGAALVEPVTYTAMLADEVIAACGSSGPAT